MLLACDVVIPKSLGKAQLLLLKAFGVDRERLFSCVTSLIAPIDTCVYELASAKDKEYINDMVNKGCLEIINGIVYVADVLCFKFTDGVFGDNLYVKLKVREDDSPWSVYEVVEMKYID